MRRLRIAVVVVVAFGLVAYTVTLGVYALSSTRADVPTQPRTPEEARASLEALGLRDAYPFESRFLETPHGRMHYVDEGRGDPVLCLHGNPTWSFLYRRFVDGLSGSARVVAPDLIGFGLSEKLARPEDYSIEGHIDDVSALVEALDLRDLTLVVQDWGGPIGLGVALRHPGRIRALVAMNTIGFVPEGRGLPLALRVLRVPGVGEQLVQGMGLFNRVFVPAAIGRPERRSEVVRVAYSQVQGNWYERAGTLAFPRLLPVDADDPVVALLEREDRWLRSFDGPALLVWGMRDPYFDAAILAQWRERLPHASVIEIDDASHFLQEDAPEVIVPHLVEFLSGSGAATGS